MDQSFVMSLYQFYTALPITNFIIKKFGGGGGGGGVREGFHYNQQQLNSWRTQLIK